METFGEDHDNCTNAIAQLANETDEAEGALGPEYRMVRKALEETGRSVADQARIREGWVYYIDQCG